ncbi:hypothetical protein CTI14_71755, partial [Methylobacterium radiotolerans]
SPPTILALSIIARLVIKPQASPLSPLSRHTTMNAASASPPTILALSIIARLVIKPQASPLSPLSRHTTMN